MNESRHRPLEFERRPPDRMLASARGLREDLERRRSVRSFSPEPLPDGLLDECVRAAGSAPSGANLQPWSFCVVSDPAVKREIRVAAEREERENYGGRMTAEWLAALRPLGTDADKPFLEQAPALVAIFRQVWSLVDGRRCRHYYTQESVGIATGMLLATLHQAGLATLTHTPSPMGFLERILGRPAGERAFVLIPVGFPAPDCQVPDIERKTLDEIRWNY